MDLIILTTCATITIIATMLFFTLGLFFSRHYSSLLALVEGVVGLVAWIVASTRGYDLGSVLVACGALLATLLFTLMAFAAGEN